MQRNGSWDAQQKKKKMERHLELLPVWEHEAHGRLRQCAWDGHQICTVEADHADMAGYQLADVGRWGRRQVGVRDWPRRAKRRAERLLQRAFLPEDVTGDYWHYMRWKCVQRFVSSINQVHGTQCMLHAVGIGAQRSLGAAAALNWVLKDGLGRLGRLTYAASFGETFDADLKRARFRTSALFTLSLGLEMLTPLMPRHFLPIATLANIGKSISASAYMATGPSIRKSFALTENLADISAKGQAQTVICDNLGLAFAVGLGTAFRKHDKIRKMIPLALYPLLSAVDLYSIAQELKSVHLRALNKERVEIIAEMWLKSGTVPSAREVSEAEGIFWPPKIGDGRLPLRIGALSETVSSPSELLAALSPHAEERYLLRVRPQSPVPLLQPFLPPPKEQLVISLRNDASTPDVITGILQATHLRSMAASVRSLDTTNHDWPGGLAVGSDTQTRARTSAEKTKDFCTGSGKTTRDTMGRGRREAREEDEEGGEEEEASSTAENRWMEDWSAWIHKGVENGAGAKKKGRGKSESFAGLKGGGVAPGGERGWEREWSAWAFEESRKRAEENVGPFLSAMEERGWQSRHIILTPSERCTYGFGPE